MHDAITFAIVAFPSLIVIINPMMVTSVFIGVESVLPEIAAVVHAAPKQ